MSAEEQHETTGDGGAGESAGTPGLVERLERVTYRAEAPLRRAVRSHRLNPLPHAGTISVFLLIVVTVTGLYITVFFGYGFEASYESVERMDDHPIQATMRGIHRYASAGLVLTTLVHAWRIFVAGRFRGPRRWRWTTGVAALVLVWLAGVTGYWLVWDLRAEALNEMTLELFGGLGWASAFLVRNVVGPDVGTGWPVMFGLWFVHLLLTAIIGYFLWRHLRRSRLPWMPARHWMAIMFGALLLVSIVFPADTLDRAAPDALAGDIPLDPFVLFLLPPLAGNWGWLVLVAAIIVIVAALALPHLVRSDPPIVEIDEERCTGCELCAIDCPYLALTMQDQSTASDDGTQPRRTLAVVDADACVGCGICLGSCSFGAMTLPGFEAPTSLDPAGKRVVIACSRHLRSDPSLDDLPDDVAIVEVACSGMIHANTVGELTKAGASSVQVVGCPPGDCAYGLGNTVLDERLTGQRAPHVSKRFAGVAAEDWVAPTELIDAIEHPNEHASADGTRFPGGRLAIGAIVVVVASIVTVALATRAPYRGHGDHAAVRVVVDHVPGQQLEGHAGPSGRRGDTVEVVIARDGTEIARERVPVSGDAAVGVVDVDIDAGSSDLTIRLDVGDDSTTLFDEMAEVDAGSRFVVNAVDTPPPPGVAEGKQVFDDRTKGGCGVCHSTKPGDDEFSPSLAGVATRAETRVPGMSAEDYLRESIIDPDAYIVDGYRAGQMLPLYEDRLSPDEIDALVEYLMTFDDAEGAG